MINKKKILDLFYDTVFFIGVICILMGLLPWLFIIFAGHIMP